MLLTPLLPAVGTSGMDQAERQQDGEAGGPGQAGGLGSDGGGLGVPCCGRGW